MKKIKVKSEDILGFLQSRKQQYFAEYHVVKLGLFGSFANGANTDESDIDLIVEFQPGTKDLFDKKSKIKSDVESHFHRPVDICREKYLKPYFKTQVLQSAIYV